jgi:hypothetical protein
MGGEAVEGGVVLPGGEQGDGAEIRGGEVAAEGSGEDGLGVAQALDLPRSRPRTEQAQALSQPYIGDVDREDQGEPPVEANLG